MTARFLLMRAGIAALVVSCGPRQPESAPAASQSPSSQPAASQSTATPAATSSNRSCSADTVRRSIRSLAAASYELHLVSTRTSRDVRGTLELSPQQDSLVDLGGGSRMPLIGAATVDVEQVGALRLGDLGSKDPRRPGVAVLEMGAAPNQDVMLRFGSSANERGRVRFDGGYLVLRVRSVTDDGFTGVWASGAADDAAAGFFCGWVIRR